jgi:hypothetical protein
MGVTVTFIFSGSATKTLFLCDVEIVVAFIDYKFRDFGPKIFTSDVGLQIHASIPFYVQEIQQTFCGKMKKFRIIVTKNAVILNFFSIPLKSPGRGDLKV